MANPPVLVLDEATSALDPATERSINDTIDRAIGGRTVLSVTHRLTAITDYDLIVVLVDGRIESQGTHEQLLAERGTYARLWAEQTGTPMPDGLTAAMSREQQEKKKIQNTDLLTIKEMKEMKGRNLKIKDGRSIFLLRKHIQTGGV